MIKVAKFGGTSLSNEIQFKKVFDIIQHDKSMRYIIASAPGSICNISDKITDMLYLCYENRDNIDVINEIFQEISQRFNNIVEKLGIDIDINRELTVMRQMLDDGCSRDYLVSRGEYINGKILAAYLEFEFVDAMDVIIFDDNGVLDTEATNKKIRAVLNNIDRAVIPGFYGAMYNGEIKTFSRGGSDITGSLISKSINADIYENWTDVSGLLMADPRIVKFPKKINMLTYRELRELAYMGATVLHDEAVFPVREANIPINIRNTNIPSDCGTLIVDVLDKSEECLRQGTFENGDNTIPCITGIAGRRGFTIFTVCKQNMASSIGRLKTALDVFEKRKIAVEHVPTGIDRFSIVVSNINITGQRDSIYEELMNACKAESVEIYDNIALIGTVGRHINNKSSVFKRIFNALEKQNIDIKLMSQCLSEINIIIGVDNDDYEKAVRAIYEEFN